MSVLFLDSCQDYTAFAQKYDIVAQINTLASSGGRSGPKYIGDTSGSPPGTGKRFGTNFTDMTVGLAFMRGNWSGWSNLVWFNDSELSGSWTDTIQCGLQFDGAGNFRFVRGSTVLATTSGPIFTDTAWHYIELNAVIDPTNGSMILRVDGIVVLSVTAINTRNTANTYVNSFQFGNPVFQNPGFCDIYVLESSGPAPWNTFLGDQKVYYAPATGNAGTNQFTPQAAARANSTAYAQNAVIIDSNGNLQLATTAGTSASSAPTWNATVGGTTTDGSVRWTNQGTPANWKYISNVPAGDAQAYLSDGTVGNVEMYSFNPVSGPGVTAVGVNIRAWKDQTYACSVRGNCTSGGVTADNGSDLALPLYLTSPSVSGAPADLLAIFKTDPATGAQWSGVAAVNAATFGVKVTAA